MREQTGIHNQRDGEGGVVNEESWGPPPLPSEPEGLEPNDIPSPSASEKSNQHVGEGGTVDEESWGPP